jgi:hypothetical protein
MTRIEIQPLPNCDDISLGWHCKEAMISQIRSELPSAYDIRTLRPKREWFIDPDSAMKKTEPHGVAHKGRLLVLGVPYMSFLKDVWQLHVQQDVVVEAIRRHDIRIHDWKSFPTHAEEAVLFFQQWGIPEELSHNWESIAYVIARHSDTVDHDPECVGIHRQLWQERQLMQDLDASDLTRPGANKPIETIRLRTLPAACIKLPYIMQLLRVTAQSIDTGDAFEDQIQAGINLGLLRK